VPDGLYTRRNFVYVSCYATIGVRTHLKEIGGMLLIDLVLLALSVFIGLRLWSLLGQKPKGPAGRNTKPNLFIVPQDQVEITPQATERDGFYPGFDESLFLKGVEKAFYQIVKAYHAQDQTFLEKRVAPTFLPAFLKNKPASLEKLTLLSSTVLSKTIVNAVAYIDVQLSSEQTCGGQTETIEEVWTFERAVDSDSPQWWLSSVTS